jgi:hypothetical protein
MIVDDFIRELVIDRLKNKQGYLTPHGGRKRPGFSITVSRDEGKYLTNHVGGRLKSWCRDELRWDLNDDPAIEFVQFIWDGLDSAKKQLVRRKWK